MVRGMRLLWVAAVLAAAGCSRADDSVTAHPAPASSDPDRGTRTDVPTQQAQPTVVFEAHGEVRVPVEVARTPRQTSRGLMYREHLPPDHGMLFLFDQEKVQSFWMKNTLIPLDMIFVTSQMVVAGVVENAEPQTEDSRSIGKPSKFVVEVNGGFARAHGIGEGTPVRFENLD
jgi:hypothetical protein